MLTFFRNIAVAACSIVALTAGVAFAQEQGPNIVPVQTAPIAAGSPNTITVNGHSELKLMPDIAKVTLTVTSQDKRESAAVNTNSKKMQAVTQAVEALGIAAPDIQTSNYDVTPDYTDPDGRHGPNGYTVTDSVDVTVRDISKTGDVLAAAEETGATVDSTGFALSNEDKARGQALSAAVANARAKAALIADGLGEKLGRVDSVTEEGAPSPPIFLPVRPGVAQFGAMNAVASPITRQDIEITADVNVTFLIDYSSH